MLIGDRLLVLGGCLPALWACSALFACSEAETRPDPLGGCEDDGCVHPGGGVPPRGQGSGFGSAGNSGSGGEGGGGGLPPPQAGTLAGSVRMITRTDLDMPAILEDPVEVRAAGATESEVSVETEADGSYRLDGVLPDAELWVAAGTFENPPVPPFLDTLQVVDATAGALVNLLVMRDTVMDDIAQISFMNTPTEFDPTQGHAILSFFDVNDTPLAGVRVVDPTVDGAAIAYDAGDVYSDQLEETAERGAVVLMNMPAVAYPGALISVTVTLDDVQYSTPVRIARGAVTVVNAQIVPP